MDAPPAGPAPLTVLVGFMGAGKTSLARALDPGAADADELLEARLGRPIWRVFAEDGEAAFRAHEERLVLELLDGGAPGSVIALGGGAVLSPRVREALRAHRVLWLHVPVAAAWSRVAGGERPLARDPDAFAALHAAREPLYAGLADVTLLGDPEPAAVRDALRALDAAPAGTRLVLGAVPGGAVPVFAARGLLGLDAGWWPAGGRRFTVTDEDVAGALGGPFAAAGPLLALPPGERHKTLAAAERVWRWLAAEGATRADHVTALGGGVVGDLAGFCAACYQRGVAVVQAPTTLVAQVDSAYGGKTGVDLPEAKNYVGAYHQPAAVVLDPAALATLPEPERAAGAAEVIKTALIAGGELWTRVRAGALDDLDTVLACARIKLAIVAEDERDTGRRQVLNLGHTVAHAIEATTGYGRYRHGEAVGLGLLAALRLSDRAELRAEVAALLAGHGLPTRLRGVAPAAVVAATARDKKRLGEAAVPFVLVHAPGDVRPGHAVAAGELSAAVEELAGP